MEKPEQAQAGMQGDNAGCGSPALFPGVQMFSSNDPLLVSTHLKDKSSPGLRLAIYSPCSEQAQIAFHSVFPSGMFCIGLIWLRVWEKNRHSRLFLSFGAQVAHTLIYA